MKTERQDIHTYWDSVFKEFVCPVCGKKRNVGNHAKCSKITQLKHQQERAAKGVKSL